ncbi:MAG: hypothetical protein PWP37_282 [Thermotogota bacterium]|nr:hypothetical protein [Thermotogota bacterium]MDK2864090.1 hypothetical protein [Thermotogota bacterium]
MKILGIGVNAHPARTDGRLDELEKELAFFQDVGYDYVEIPVDAVDVIYKGRLHQGQLSLLKELLGRFNLKYTVHAPNALDLRDMENFEVQKELFKSCVDFTKEIGAQIFVYHYGRMTENPEVERKMKEAVEEIADYAGEKDVFVCVENIEIDVVDHVLEFVGELNHPSVWMTLDLGHAYLSAKHFGFDFLESVKNASPYVKHIHVQDNFGVFERKRLAGYDEYKLIPYRRLLALGKGDLHLPPGWGEIPFDEAFKLLENYEGVFMLEYHHQRYRSQAKEIYKAAKAYVERHRS